MLKQVNLAAKKLSVNVITACPMGQFCLKDKRTAESAEASINKTATTTTKANENSSALKPMAVCVAMTLLLFLNQFMKVTECDFLFREKTYKNTF